MRGSWACGWMVCGGWYDMNARAFVRVSTEPLNFPAARSREAGTCTQLANRCGPGPQSDVSGLGQAAECWQLGTEHSSLINSVEGTPKTLGVS